MGGCCGGPKAAKPEGKGVPKPEKKEGEIETKNDEENPAPADAAPADATPADDAPAEEPAADAGEEAPAADGEEAKEAGDEPAGDDGEAAAAAGGDEAPAASGEPAQHIALVSTTSGPEAVFDMDTLERVDEPEVYGDVDWQTLFTTMKTNAEEAGKEVPVRMSRRDPEDSQANKFYMAEQIFDQSVEDKKSPPSLIDLHVIRCMQALQDTSDRFVQIQEDLDASDQGGRITPNVGDGKHHILKVLCGQGTHSEKDENGNSLTVMKYAMKQWLMANERAFSGSMHHGCFFVVFEKAGAE